MFKEIDEAVLSYKMFDGKKNVLVALSGGADSMCLLHYLVTNSQKFGITVTAAHVNHCLRGEESERDSQFVTDWCNKLNVPLFIKKIDIAVVAAERKIGLEQCGREERYGFFESLVNSDDTVIATAHTASDNAETVLLNITRGCGMEGLTGIPAVRGNIVRPLINASRGKIEKYCKENNVPFVTDSSNLCDDYSRNKIRLSVVPTLQKINPSVEGTINRMSNLILENLAFIDSAVKSEYNRCVTDTGLNIELIKEIDKNILSSVLKYAVDVNLCVTAEKKHIDLIKKIIYEGHGAVEMRKDKDVKVEGNTLVFINKCDKQKVVEKFDEVTPVINQSYHYNGKNYRILEKKTEKATDNDKINKKLLNQRISCDIMLCGVLLRTRRSGDIFKPFGRNCTKTVKKLFTEMKIPQEQRDTRLVLAKENKVYWIEGIGVSQEAIPKSTDNSFVIVEITDENNQYL